MTVITKVLYSILVFFFFQNKATNHRMYIGFSEVGLTDIRKLNTHCGNVPAAATEGHTSS